MIEYPDEEAPKPKKKVSKQAISEDESLPETPAQEQAGADDSEEPPWSEMSSKKLRKRLALYTEEYQLLAPDQSSAAVTRRVHLYRILRSIQELLDAREEIVEVRVPRSPHGIPFVLGQREFPPGTYQLRASVAGYLLWLIGTAQRVELARLQQNGRDIDLGTIGDRARQIHAAITREG